MATTGSSLVEVAARLGHTSLMLIADTGASISIIPKKYSDGFYLSPTPVSITSANGSKITCYGESTVTLNIPALRRSFIWSFVIADTVNPLLGADFLGHFGLLVDCKNFRLVDSTTKHYISGKDVSSTVQQIVINKLSSVPGNVKPLLEKYSSLLTPRAPDASLPDSKVRHCIDTGNNCPTFAKVRQLSQDKYQAAKQEFTSLLQAGIIRQSKSPWNSPLHLVPKSTPGKWRACGDYRVLNSITKPDRYPIPHLQSVAMKLENMKIFSKLDLLQAYHQIPVQEEDIEKTAVLTPFGLYEYLFMPYGLKNAGATFQRFMDNIFLDLKCVFVYLDDVLIFSESEEQHHRDIESVFKVLHENKLRLSIDKCTFFQDNMDYLGFNISANGIIPTTRKVAEIEEFPTPNDSKSLRRFLGMVGFYRRLIPRFANIVLPLTEVIKNQPNAKKLDFTDVEEESFRTIKKTLADLTALPHPSASATHFQIVADSSNYAVGAALHQICEGEPIPIGFFSKKLTAPQQKLAAFDRELLAAYLAVLHFRPQIEGRHVTLFTDHRPLVSAYRKTTPLKSDKQQRHMSLISEYVADILYIRGQENIVADCLSRAVNAVSVDVFDLPEIAALQKEDEELQEHKEKLKNFPLGTEELWCDTSTPSPRPFIPSTLRKSLFCEFHGISHPGVKSSVRLIKARYFWPNMDKDIRIWTRECQDCQQSKIHRHTKTEVHNFNLPSARFDTVHIDIVGPLPPVTPVGENYPSNFRYLLTCIDRATRWIEATPMKDITASTVAVSFLHCWISRFGVPLHVVTDRGTQFESELFKELSSLVGFHRLRTTPYHPQANGMMERQHRTLKAAIVARKQNWIDALPIVLLGMRNTPLEQGYSPAVAVTGTPLLVPRPMINRNDGSNFTSETVQRLAQEMAKIDFRQLSEGRLHSVPRIHIPHDLKTCTHVWLRIDRVRRPLEAPYAGPFKVLHRHEKYYIIELQTGNKQSVSLDRLKPVIMSQQSTPEEPPPSTPDISPEPSSETPESSAFEEDTSPQVPSSPPRRTRQGRTVTFKKNNDYHYY